MPRPEEPLDRTVSPLHAFACDLRDLRRRAGAPPYRLLAQRAGFSAAALSCAADGKRLPSLEVTLAYVGACGGDSAEWERRWQELQSQVRPAPAPMYPEPTNPGPVEEPGVAAPSPRIRDLLDELAAALDAQWRTEVRAWGLTDPAPLPVGWCASARDVADHPDVVFGDAAVAEAPRCGRAGELAATFRSLPARRLVVLGEAGSGKSVMAVRTVLDLLAGRRPGDPVPVLLPMSGWDPAELPVPEWIAGSLAATHPRLRAQLPGGGSLARRLVDAGLLIPVLDGFDELPEPVRPAAVRDLNRSLGRTDPLVLTSRPAEYERAVHDPGGDVLTAAMVIDLTPLAPGDVCAYLRRATAPHRVDRWRPVFARLTDQPDGPLATALSTPLMAWLVRRGYADEGADPAPLLAPGLAGRSHVEDHLLDRFLPIMYGGAASRRSGTDPRRAERWLTFLARHLDELGTSELAWWQLERAVPRWVLGLLGGAVFGVAVGLSIGLSFALTYPASTALRAGALTTAGAALTGGAVIRLWRPARHFAPTAVRWNLRRPAAVLGPQLREGLVVGPIGGAVIAVALILVGAVTRGWAFGVTTGLAVGAATALGLILTSALDTWLGAPVDVMRSATPAGVLRGDRVSALAKGAAAGLSFGLAFGAVRGWTAGVAAGAAAALSRCLVGDLDQVLRRTGRTAWSRFVLARCWLAVTGRLPWRTMAFLREAHRLGVLRQAGAVYQFRHDRLRDRLAQRPPGHRPGWHRFRR